MILCYNQLTVLYRCSTVHKMWNQPLWNWIYFQKISALPFISWHWDGTGSWNHSLPRYQQPWCWLYKVNCSLRITNKDFYNLSTLVSRNGMKYTHDFDGLMQERRDSNALAMELCLSCINPSILYFINAENFFTLEKLTNQWYLQFQWYPDR